MAVRTWAQLRAAFANNNSGAITAADIRDFVDTTEAESVSQLNELLKTEMRFRVSATGGVSNLAPGRLAPTATNTGAGVYVLTPPAGYRFAAIVGTAVSSPTLIQLDTYPAGSGPQTYRTFLPDGSPANRPVAFMATAVEV